MKHVGKYIYGIISSNGAENFGPIGIGGQSDEVMTLGSEGLAAVVSNASMDHYVLSRENMTAHMKVIEKVMELYNILPMRFCTVADTSDEIISFLERNSKELTDLLRDMDGKVEMDIKVRWKDMKKIYQEIAQENRKIRDLKSAKPPQTQRDLIHAGELVAAALEKKKAAEGEGYLVPFKKLAKGSKTMESGADEVVIHEAFLIDKDWLKEFDQSAEKLAEKFGDRLDVKSVGPMAPFSFVTLQLHWNE
ncbi:MAG: GvpL/GvpF family gas vesicle protein [Chlamydiae bacterium]|nr:GvpL/GvpF family gas vesicle protein [Chlamydiota bacterium]MBI3266492.1 GvpL/GvpF family gas vesicle protein [Chlamydiota bacterium]